MRKKINKLVRMVSGVVFLALSSALYADFGENDLALVNTSNSKSVSSASGFIEVKDEKIGFNYIKNLNNPAALAALADGVSTVVALNNGAIESNPFYGSNPSNATIATFTLAKVLATPYIRLLPNTERKTTMGAVTGIWSAASVNNILIAMGASNPVAITIAIGLGYHIGKQAYNDEKEIILKNQ